MNTSEIIYDSDCQIVNKCPDCGGTVSYYNTCHSYGGKPDGSGWKICIPCDSALRFYCTDEECDWTYVWGLNPRNPVSRENEKQRPIWIEKDSRP